MTRKKLLPRQLDPSTWDTGYMEYMGLYHSCIAKGGVYQGHLHGYDRDIIGMAQDGNLLCIAFCSLANVERCVFGVGVVD